MDISGEESLVEPGSQPFQQRCIRATRRQVSPHRVAPGCVPAAVLNELQGEPNLVHVQAQFALLLTLLRRGTNLVIGRDQQLEIVVVHCRGLSSSSAP